MLEKEKTDARSQTEGVTCPGKRSHGVLITADHLGESETEAAMTVRTHRDQVCVATHTPCLLF